MKNFFLIIALSSLSILSKAQGNLQFNKAKLVSTIDTVPSGKVWKIESIIYSSTIVDALCNTSTNNSCNSNSKSDNIIINGNSVTIRQSSTVTGSYNFGYSTSLLWEQKLPIWLNQGNTISSSNGVLYVNVLEFNITP
jgi:hypothetical protein